MPGHQVNFIRFQDTGMARPIEKGGLLNRQEDGAVIEEVERGLDPDVLELLQAVAKRDDCGCRPRQNRTFEGYTPRVDYDENQDPKGDRPPEGVTMELNTMHKTKDKKVQPVHDSTVVPHKVEGRNDWRERAAARHPPNEDQSWRQFSTLIRDRTAPFPKGLRVTEERFKDMKIAGWLWPREVDMLKEVFWCREAALSFDFSESGRIHPDVVPPIKLNTIPHDAWKEGNFPIPRKLREEVSDMVQQRLTRGVLELSKSPYSNPWFLVKKKDKGYRLINNAVNINRVTVRDANLPPNPDEFSEEFAGCHIVSLIDFFSGYDQVELHEESRPLTAFYTPTHGLVQQCTLPMGTTNSVAEFVRVVTKILQDLIPKACMPYMDDIAVKGPKDSYNVETMIEGVRRFVGEHIVNIDKVLWNLEMAGATASGFKSEWCYDSLGIVGYTVDKHGRHPAQKKVDKILSWPSCTCPKDVRMFIGMCVYYRIWIECFAIIAAPLFLLLRKDVVFAWTAEAEGSMTELKKRLTEAPALVSIDYSEPMRPPIVSVDGSKQGWGAVIHQEDPKGRRRAIRFESGVWSQSERNWDSGKHECKALLLALKKFRPWLYGVYFIVETDARTLVDQLNRTASDLPGALVTRWLALLNMWEFEIRHVAGKKNVVADALSRRPTAPGWTPPEEPEDDVEDFIDRHLGAMTLEAPQTVLRDLEFCSNGQTADMGVLDTLKTEKFRRIAQWLLTLKNPAGLDRKELQQLRKAAQRYCVVQDTLWERTTGGRPLRRVVDDPTIQQQILHELHEESGHRGREGTWRKVWSRYSWPGMFSDVDKHIRTCKPCQMHSPRTLEEELHPIWGPEVTWGWIIVDVVYMPDGKYGKKYLVLCRDYVSSYVEGRALRENTSANVAKFLKEEVFTRWGLPFKLIVDGGPENRGLVTELARLYGIRRVVGSAYHPQGQGLIERGHKEIVSALRKMKGNWVDNLPMALWADRVTVKRTTQETPLYLISGKEPILPVDLSVPTWQALPWSEVRDTATLLALRARQFDHRDQRLQDAIDRTIRLREEGKQWFDAHKQVRQDTLAPGTLVLLRDSFGDQNKSREQKLRPRWKGPFRVTEGSSSGWYMLEELDGTPLGTRKPGNRVVEFHQRNPVEMDELLRPDAEEVPTVWDHTDPEPEGPSGEEDQPQDAAFSRQLRSAKARYGQDATPTPRLEPRVEVQQRAGFDRAEYEAFDEDVIEEDG
jgi:transposase InsO family protein